MGMRILVALDDSENAMRAAEFVARNFTPEHQITIFSVFLDTAMICDYYSPGLTPYFLTEQKSFCELEDKRRAALKNTQQSAKDLFIGAGFPEANINVKMQAKSRGVARDIIEEASSGYQIVVLGRRGLSGIGEFFLGSVSQKVLHGCKEASILLVS
ncbi:MAG: universal stress protein [Desulfobacteraceae bacterium]|nr:MAG: universal stress protein [Desulfobacteraceae bacterium]